MDHHDAGYSRSVQPGDVLSLFAVPKPPQISQHWLPMPPLQELYSENSDEHSPPILPNRAHCWPSCSCCCTACLEAFLIKMCMPFLVASKESGGLELSTAEVGIVYGTIGVIFLTLGGILGGLFASRIGLKNPSGGWQDA